MVNKSDLTVVQNTDVTQFENGAGNTVDADQVNANFVALIGYVANLTNYCIDSTPETDVATTYTATQTFQVAGDATDIEFDYARATADNTDMTFTERGTGRTKITKSDATTSPIATEAYVNAKLLDPNADLDAINFTGATASVDGASGTVPAPSAGDEGKFLRGDATWVKSNAPSAWETKAVDFTAADGGRYVITADLDMTLINSPSIDDEFWVIAGDGFNFSTTNIDILQAASGEKIGGVDADGKLIEQAMYRIVYSDGDTTTGWRILKVLIQGESYGEGLLIPSSDPAPFFKLPEALPNVSGASTYSSSGNFSLTAGTHYYTDFTINVGHQMTLAAGTTVLMCSGTVTIGGNGVINVTGTAPTIGDSFVLEADGTAGTDASTGGTGGSGGPAGTGDGGAGTQGGNGSNATGANVLGGSARGGGGGGGAGHDNSGSYGAAGGGTGGSSISATGATGSGGGGGGGGAWRTSGGTAGVNSATNGNGGRGGHANGAGGGGGGAAGSQGSAGSNSASALIIIADTIVVSADILNNGGAGSDGSGGSNGGNGSGTSRGGGGGGGGGAGGKGGKGALTALVCQSFTQTAGTISCSGGAGGNGGGGGDGGDAGPGGNVNEAGGGGGGAGSGGPGGIGGDAGCLYIQAETFTLTSGTRVAAVGAAGTEGSTGSGGTGNGDGTGTGSGGDGGIGGTNGTSGVGRAFDEVNNSMQIRRSLR
jgi:hypothetical protein